MKVLNGFMRKKLFFIQTSPWQSSKQTFRTFVRAPRVIKPRFFVNFSLLLSAFFLLSSVLPVSASLVVVKESGKIIYNVLSSEKAVGLEVPSTGELSAREIVTGLSDPTSKVTLMKSDGKVTLNVSSSLGERSLDVTDYNDQVVEIEERPEVQRVLIGVLGDKFTIDQQGVRAVTGFEIDVDSESARLSLITQSGSKYLAVLPRQAVDTTLRAKYISHIDKNNQISIIEQNGSDLSYEISGDKLLNIFNILEYPVPVKVWVSASTGEILSVEQPVWLKVFGFVFA